MPERRDEREKREKFNKALMSLGNGLYYKNISGDVAPLIPMFFAVGGWQTGFNSFTSQFHAVGGKGKT